MTEVELNLWRRFVEAAQAPSTDEADVFTANMSRLLRLRDALSPIPPKQVKQPVNEQARAVPSGKEEARDAGSDELIDDVSVYGQNRLPEPSGAAAAEASENGLVPKARVVSLRSVDVRTERTGLFFRSLTWRRHDPSMEPEQMGIEFEAIEDESPVESCRLFFAYLVPWSGRGIEPEGPQVLDGLAPVSRGLDISSLADMATRQALQSAAKMKQREKDLVQNYLNKPSQAGGASTFFQSIPWSEPRNRNKPQPVGASS